MAPSIDVMRRLRPVGYLLSILLFLLPLGEIVTTAWPFLWGQPLWRFSIGGMAGASSATMLVGMLLMLAIAIASQDRRVAWVVCIVSAFALLGYLGGAALFFLDAVQLSGNVPTQDPGRYKVTAIWILVKLALSGIAFVALMISAARTAKALPRERARAANGASPIVVGR
jgi:hypothetical protein